MRPLSNTEQIVGWTLSLVVITVCCWALVCDYGDKQYTRGWMDAQKGTPSKPLEHLNGDIR